MEERYPCFTVLQLLEITRYDEITLRKLLKHIPHRRAYSELSNCIVDCYESSRVYAEIINNTPQVDSMSQYLQSKKGRGEM